MARTHRNNNPKEIQSIRRSLNVNNEGMCIEWKRRQEAILRGDDGRISYDKCQSAKIDNEGGYKLDTFSSCGSKRNSKEARSRLRKAGKIIAIRQLEDVD